MSIRAIMTTNIIAVTPKTPVRAALELLVEHHISGLPVVTDDDRIVGVISEVDLLRLFFEDGVETVGQLMTKDPRTFHVDDPIVDVVDCLMSNNFRRVMIHDKGKLVGLVSRADLMPTILATLVERTG